MNVTMEIITKFAPSSDSACISRVSENKVQLLDTYIKEICLNVVFIRARPYFI